MADHGAVCVHCGNAVPSLYTEYSRRNIRLLACNNCHQTADPFVEMGILELFVALVLHRPMVYIHAIHNRGSLEGALGKELVHAVFRLPLLALLAEGYIVWSCAVKMPVGDEFQSGLMMTTRWIVDTIFSVRFDGGENTGNGQILATVVDVGMQQMVFRASVFALAMSGASLTTQPVASAQKIATGVILSELSVVVIAMMVICGYPHHLYLMVVLLCQLASLLKGIHHAAGLSLGVSTAVILVAWSIRLAFADRMLGAVGFLP